MLLTRRKVTKLLDPGDAVYILGPGGVIPSKVLEICDDCLVTEEDTLFFDEHTFTWMFTNIEAEKMALKSQKRALK